MTLIVNGAEGSRVRIVSLLGRVLNNTIIDSSEERIDLSNLPKSVYLVSVIHGSSSQTIKIVN
jgi:hypothetical protein